MKGQKGFTLIELVMVILLLGILAAVALPRFLNLTNNAQKAVVNGVYGGYGSAVAVARASWMVNGAIPGTVPAGCSSITCTTGFAITTDGITIGYSGLGNPANNAAPVMIAGVPTMTTTTCMNTWQAILGNQGPTIALAAAVGIDWVPTVATPVCTFTYYGGTTTSTGRLFTYNGSTGAMTITNP